ncbi:MAG: sodium:solute symporter family protein [Candidatus Marinimicrobia bacterium]|nr:sodium:solute symporter family protein [Candidatus Neomarinimicrobiota bacterium]
MKIELSNIDIFIIIAYLVILFLIGFIRKSNDKSSDNYFLSGRRITTPIFIMTLVSTWYGGILGIGEFTYQYGISNWLVFAFPYYIFAFIFAIFLAKKIQKNKNYTIPELIEKKYGYLPSIVSSFFVFFLISPAPYLLIVGVIFSLIFPGSNIFWAIIIFIISSFYLYKKGFKSVVQTDILQFSLMFIGFIVLFIMLMAKYPIINQFKLHLPQSHLSLTGGLPITYLISWFFIALWTIVDPGFHQRCSAAKSPKVARNGILLSIIFWAIFDMLTLTIGLYAKTLLPNIEPIYTYPLIAAKMLPIGMLGLFFTGLIATVMSTLDSYLFISAQTVGYDILYKSGMKISKNNSVKIGYLITGITAIILLFLFPSVIKLWYLIGSIIIPTILLPVIFAFTKKQFPSKVIILSMIGSFSISLIWLLYGIVNKNISGNQYLFSIEPFYPGMLFSLVVIFGWILFKDNKIKN